METPRDEEMVLGKSVSDLQTGVSIADTRVSGTLNYVDNFEKFNEADIEEQKGNFLAIKVKEATEGKIVTAKISGTGTKGKSVTLDSDGILISRISDNDNKITLSIEDKEKILILEDLVLTPEG